MAIDSNISFLNQTEKKLSTEVTAADMNKVLTIISDIMQGFNIQEKEHADPEDNDIIESYFDAMRVKGIKSGTERNYRFYIRDLMNYAKVPIRSITVYHLRSFLASLKDKGLKESSLSNARSIFSSCFGWLHREGLIDKNPVGNLAAIKVPKKKKELYSDIDIAKLKAGCERLRDKAIIYLLDSSMCRISELVGLNRDSIDFENRQFIVHGKGDKERIAFLDKVTAYIIKEYLNTREDNCEALFVNRYDERISGDGIRFILKDIAKKVNVNHVHPHKFRRTSATNNARRGMPVQHIQFLLGHDNIDTTMEYVQVLGESAKAMYAQYVG